MYVDRLLEEKKKLNLSARTIADMSTLHLSEDTVNRVLMRKTNNPGIDTIESIARTLGMELYEVFMDSTVAAEFRAFLELRGKSDESEVQRLKLVADYEELQKTNAGNVDRLRVLEMETEHQKKQIALMEELLDRYREKNETRSGL